MKMSFEDLKERIIKYITKPHHHSTWNLNDLHFMTKRDKSSKHNMHYYVSYGDENRRFKISICNNNIKLTHASNIPGSFHDHKGRILGACLDFVRHNGSQAYVNNHCYSKDSTANKWEQYDIQQFDKNGSLNTSTNPNVNPQSTKESSEHTGSFCNDPCGTLYSTLMPKESKATFNKNAKATVKSIDSLKISKAFKQLVHNMQSCGFTLMSYGSYNDNMPIVAEFISSDKTCVSINVNKDKASVSNPYGLNLTKVVKPRQYVRNYYAAVKGAQKDKTGYSFKI